MTTRVKRTRAPVSYVFDERTVKKQKTTSLPTTGLITSDEFNTWLQSDFAKQLRSDLDIEEMDCSATIVSSDTQSILQHDMVSHEDVDVDMEGRSGDDDCDVVLGEKAVSYVKNKMSEDTAVLLYRVRRIQDDLDNMFEKCGKEHSTPVEVLDIVGERVDKFYTKLLALCNLIPKIKQKMMLVRDKELFNSFTNQIKY